MIPSIPGAGNPSLALLATKRQAESARARADALTADAGQARRQADAAEQVASELESDARVANVDADRKESSLKSAKASTSNDTPRSGTMLTETALTDTTARMAAKSAALFDRRGGISFTDSPVMGQFLNVSA